MLFLKNIYKKCHDNLKNHPYVTILCLYFIISIISSYILYKRFPNNFIYPNFYAEDAWYAENIIKKGFLQSILLPFNGYLIVGIYLIQGFGFTLNQIILGGGLLTLPKAISIASYLFLGFTLTLPILLLKRFIHPFALIWLIIISIFIPLPLMDHGILGNTANLKFIFYYIAILLLIYRHFSTNKYWVIWIVDLLVLLCCLTNIATYLLIPFIFFRYLSNLKNKDGLKNIVRDKTFYSMLILLSVLVLHALFLFFSLKNNIRIGGVYDKPYAWDQTIEIFIARSYLFGFIYTAYTSLSNAITIILFLIFIGSSLVLTYKKYRGVVIFMSISVFAITLLLIVGRPGLSTLFKSYTSGGYDQYFFCQNIISYLIVAFAFSGILIKVKSRKLKFILLLIPFTLFLQIPNFRIFSSNNSMAERQGTIINNAHNECAKHGIGNTIKLNGYPYDIFKFTSNKKNICNKETESFRSDISRIALRPGKDIIFNPGKNDKFTQTFLSKKPNLSGVSFLLATYSKPMLNTYYFTLMDSSCSNIIYREKINRMFVSDGEYYLAIFPKILNSQNYKYCFSVNLVYEKSQNYPIALRLTDDNMYIDGEARINSIVSDKDIVFGLVY